MKYQDANSIPIHFVLFHIKYYISEKTCNICFEGLTYFTKHDGFPLHYLIAKDSISSFCGQEVFHGMYI